MSRTKRDEAMRRLEMKHILEVLNRDQGNTMRRYVDPKLREELDLLPRKKRLTSKIEPTNLQVIPRWDKSHQGFIVYHCTRHNFDPSSVTIQTKCFPRNCTNLTLQRKKEIFVETLKEALDIKGRLNDVWIEQIGERYRLAKAHVR